VTTVAQGEAESGAVPIPEADLEELYRAKAEGELRAAARDLAGAAFEPTGDPTASTLFVKGEPGPADIAHGRALAGPDADAATASLEALALPADWLALVTRGPGEGPADPGAVRRAVEAVDPDRVVALDAAAAEDAAAALGVDRLPFGRPVMRQGRVWLAVDGLERSLSEPALKRSVWAQLRTLGDL
jgi:hypothetical protein